MVVHAVIFDPQGSMGGFAWFEDETYGDPGDWKASNYADDIGRDLVLGIVQLEFDDDLSPDQITCEIDANLTRIEARLGYRVEVA